MPMQAEFPIGTPVFIWARPEDDLILLMGDGVFDGMNYINGQAFPVVRLVDGREVTVHTVGIFVGEKESVQKTCARFKGKVDVVAWDIELYMSGKRPAREQRTTAGVVMGADGSTAPVDPEAAPKTPSDRVISLKKRIEYERVKIAAAEASIVASNKSITEYKAEIAALRDAVMQEFADLDNVPAEAILAAAERIKAEQAKAAALTSTPVPQVVTNHVAPSDDEHRRLALED